LGRFTDKVAIVTGSGKGIGRAIAGKLAGEGASVTICDIAENTAKAAAEEINAAGGRAIYVVGDVSRAEDVQNIVQKTVDAFGTVHILVNNAGTVRDLKITDMTEEDWDLVVDVCLKGSFLCAKYVVPYMIEQKYGKVVNIASRAYMGNPGQANYSSAKAGVVGLTKALAKELGKYNINVNAVAPGLIDTDIVKAHPKYEKLKEMAQKNTPIPRIGEVEDVANAVAFFASDDVAFITGDVLHVTGGRFG